MVVCALTSPFDILPAIDLRGGRVVRLEQGDFARETAFSDDPALTAKRFADAGAPWLHVVDLDGAQAGRPVQTAVIGSIVQAVRDRVAVEVAGGLRTPEAVGSILDAGAARAVVGTAALRDPGFARLLVERHGAEHVAVALDVRGGAAVGDAWRTDAVGTPVVDALENLTAAGVRTFEVTAIDRDGLLGGPDLELYRGLVALGLGSIVASAGIASRSDIEAVRAVGCTGAIIGRALYDGRLTIADALG